jgi:hypothetical protein
MGSFLSFQGLTGCRLANNAPSPVSHGRTIIFDRKTMSGAIGVKTL